MLKVQKEGVILSKTFLSFEDQAVLNPAIYQSDNTLHLFYRAVHAGNYSSIGYCLLNGPKTIIKRNIKPIIYPHYDYESHGVEDPRIVLIDNLFYLSYTAFNGVNALGCLALSDDLIQFHKWGVIVPQLTYETFKSYISDNHELLEKYTLLSEGEIDIEKNKNRLVWDKNVVFFPRRIKGKLIFLHRIKPEIQIVSIFELDELTEDFWINYLTNLNQYIVLKAKYKHELSYIGAGCPPIETELGWILIYHSVYETLEGFVYNVCVSLLDLENPQIELARLPQPLFQPDQVWEKQGQEKNVCFPTGTALFGDKLFIYYGAADEQIACASVSLIQLKKELLANRY